MAVKFDNESYERGIVGENNFRSAAEKRGWTVIRGNEKDEKVRHIDFFIRKGDDEISIEVKGRKGFTRREPPQDEWVWIELHGKYEDTLGWLRGDATVIAFETEKTFVIVMRKDLFNLTYKLLQEKMIDSSFVYSPYDAKYRLYNRQEHEVTTLIEMSEIKKIRHMEWEKE